MPVINLYKEMQECLFPNIKEEDYFTYYIQAKCGKQRKMFLKINSSSIYQKQKIVWGEKTTEKINIKPGSDFIFHFGYEFDAAIIYLFNNQYWLVSLWLSMYRHAMNNDIAKEIVRAFIKNCINVTARELVMTGNKVLSTRLINTNWLSETPEYYRKIFTVNGIVREMRLKQRRQMISLGKRRKNPTKFINLTTGKSEEILIGFFNNSGLYVYQDLIELTRNFYGDNTIKGLFEKVMYLVLSNADKKKLKKLITDLNNEVVP